MAHKKTTNKEIVIKELTDLVKHNQEHTSLVNAIIAALADKWNDETVGSEINPLTAGCNGVPMPKDQPTPYGHYSCTANGWVWVVEFGD